MDLLKPLVRHFSWDFFLRRDGYDLTDDRRSLTATQFLSADRLADLQLRRLRALLTFAYEHNAFYRKRFQDCGFVPADFSNLSDLSRLPILTKDDIRSGLINSFSDGYMKDNCIHNRTGGSTGVPLHTYMDMAAVAYKKAATERHNAWANLHPGDRLAAVWGDTDKPQPLTARIRNALTDRAVYLDTLKFDRAHLDRFIAEIRALSPPVMMGHAHSIFRFAEYAREQGADDLRFKGIITTAMVLSDSERAVIEDVFHSPVFNRYGCEELSLISSECEAHQGMHVFGEGLYVELVGENSTQPRPLVITDLVNRAMPMIRYEIGDYGTWQPGTCRCGRSLPRLREVSGRTADFLYRPDRTPVFGISILDTFVIHIHGFKQVQIVQDRYDHLDFFIVKDAAFNDDSLIRLKANVVEIFGPDMRFDVTYVERIEQTERGKYRFSICKIDKDRPA